MKIIGLSEKTRLPKPTGSLLLVRKEKKSQISGLELPDSYAGQYAFFIEAIGPDLVEEHFPIGAEVELNPKLALARAVMLSNDHCLMPYDSIVGIYEAS